jgi:ABC-type sugar transport system permease subunit
MIGQSGSKRALVAALFLAPSLLPLVLFTLGPMAASFVISLLRWDLLRPAQWKGLDNYLLLIKDPDFHAAIEHTLFFIAGYLPLVFVGGLAIALALNQRLRAVSLFRTIYFLPVVTSWVVVAFMWKWLLNPGCKPSPRSTTTRPRSMAPDVGAASGESPFLCFLPRASSWSSSASSTASRCSTRSGS